jgi:hypothetical protein
MLNLNLNYIDPFNKRNRNLLTGRVDFTWSRTTSTAAGALAPIVYGTGSISFVPYAPSTVFFSSSLETGSLTSGSAIGQPVDISVTGSGVWPVTGSNTLSIVIGSSLGFNQSKVLTLSAAAGNMNLSGSRISSSFTPESNNEYNIDFGITHTKGNIYNPLVNWIVQNISSVSDTVAINGYTSSFQIVKNENEELAYVNEVTSSKSASFNYLYNFGVTSSLEANVNNVTGSTTMSFFTNNGVLPVTAKFFNPTTTIAYATASFVATTDDEYVISASVEYNKGNEANSDINWLTFATSDTQDLEGTAGNINGVSASFQLKKDIAVMAGVNEITSSVTGTYPNDYSFNQTASLTSNVNNTTGSVTMSISIPEAGINVETKFFNPTTTTATLTASFAAQKNVADYNVTASVINNKGNTANSKITWFVTGSHADDYSPVTASFEIVKDASVQMVGVDDITESTGSFFRNQYAFNITASLSGSFSSSFTNIDSSSISTTKWRFKSDKLGFDTQSISASVDFSASFEAQTNVDSYDITGSAISRIESSSLVQTYTIGAANSSSFVGEIVQKDLTVIGGLKMEANAVGYASASVALSASMNLFTSSLLYPGNFTYITTYASSSNGSTAQLERTIKNASSNYFPWPFRPTYIIGTSGINVNYWGKPSMRITGSVSTYYDSGSNITFHSMAATSSLEYSASFTPTTGSHLSAQTLTVGGGGRGGVKDYIKTNPEQPTAAYIFSGAGGAGGYVLTDNYFKKGTTYNVVVGAGASRYDGNPITINTITSGSDTYIYGDGVTVQLSKGGGFGGPITGSAWNPDDSDIFGVGGRAGGSGGGAGKSAYTQIVDHLGADSITGSVVNPFEVYGAFDGFNGGTTHRFLSPFITYAIAGGGGGASKSGSGDTSDVNGGAGGLGKYDLSLTMGGVAGGGAGANSAADQTGSFSFGGGQSQRYTVSGSLIACDGVDGTGGGGGGLISGSLQPGQAPFNYTTKGGSGRVQIRYVSAVPLASGGTIESGSISGSNYILHTFLSSSTFTVFE